MNKPQETKEFLICIGVAIGISLAVLLGFFILLWSVGNAITWWIGFMDSLGISDGWKLFWFVMTPATLIAGLATGISMFANRRYEYFRVSESAVYYRRRDSDSPKDWVFRGVMPNGREFERPIAERIHHDEPMPPGTEHLRRNMPQPPSGSAIKPSRNKRPRNRQTREERKLT